MNYLVLKATTFVFVNQGKVLLYDSIQNIKQFYDNSNIAKVFKNRYHGLNVFAIDIITDEIQDLANRIKESEMGWLASDTKAAPFQPCLMPALNFDDKGNIKDKLAPITKNLNKAVDDVLKIMVFVDVSFSNEKDLYSINYQTIFARNNTVSRALDAFKIKKFIPSLKTFANLFEIAVVCNNTCNGPVAIDLLKHFYTLVRKRTKMVLYIDGVESLKDSNVESTIKLTNSFHQLHIVLCVYGYQMNFELIQKVKYFASRSVNNVELKIAVQKQTGSSIYKEHLNELQQIIYAPVYNGGNMDFFCDNVFLSKDEIYQLKPTANDVLMNQVLNANYFGNIIIDSEGMVYSRPNGKMMGDIQPNQDIVDFIENNAISDDWFLTRNKVSPCSNCLFQYICPPISNYEFIFNRYNLCGDAYEKL